MSIMRTDKCLGLLTAARNGDVVGIRRCLLVGESPNCIDESGFTPLMLLALHGNSEGLQLILDAPGCIVNKRTSDMQVALHFASEKGHTDCVRRLLESRAMVNVSNDWGETPLLKAVCSGNLETVELLLKSGAKTDMTDLQGYNALIYAAQIGNVAVTDILVQFGACVNHGTKTLPLHQAVAYGHVKTTEALLNYGARQTIRDLHGWLPIEIATHTDQAEAIDCLILRGASQEDIDMAVTASARYNAIKSMRVLLARGGDPDSTDYQGLPALFTAVDLGNVDIAWQLIQHNCNVNRSLSRAYLPDPTLRDAFSFVDLVSPMGIAILRGNELIVKLLAYTGASSGAGQRMNRWPGLLPVNARIAKWLNSFFSTPLSLAHLSRLAVRKSLRRLANGTICQLPIPRPMMDYLELKGLLDHLELRDGD